MNKDKSKSDKNKSCITTKDLIKYVNSPQVPPLTNSIEIEGLIIKEFPFIRGNSAIFEWKYSNFKSDISSDNLTLLSTQKNEILNQIELNRNFCIEKYKAIKLSTGSWLRKKFQRFGRDEFYISNSELANLNTFLTQIYWMQDWIMIGMEMDYILQKIEKNYPSEIIVEAGLYMKTTVTLDINELIKISTPLIESIESIVSRTLPLYFEYVNIQSLLYQIDVKELFDKIDKDALYLEILNTQKGVKAGKIALVQYIKQKFNCPTEPKAFIKADEIHRRVRGKYLYKDFNGYEVSKSGVDMEKIYKILNSVK